MCLIHFLAYSLIVALVECFAHCKNAILLTENKLGSAIILFANFSLHFLKLLPCAVAQCLESAFGMLCGNMLDNILAAVAAVVVGRTCQFVLNNRIKQYKFVAFGHEWEILKLAAAAVE